MKRAATVVLDDRIGAAAGAIARVESWKDKLLRGKPRGSGPGSILANLANAHTALRHAPDWDGVLGFNLFHYRAEAVRATPWGYFGRWDDHQDRLTADWLQHHQIGAGPEVAGQAIQTVSRERTFHPLREFLSAQVWDGVERIGQWTALNLGTENNDYCRAVGERFLIGLIARAYQPGCKLDSAPILENAQGTFKSTAAKIIGGEYFTDELADFGSKDAALQLSGVWLIELSELDAMGRTEVAKVKAFMSRTHDRFRPPYAKSVIEVPRGCAFIGTTNADTYLRDETGARRFWPLRCGRIDIDALKRDRNQLLAEARVRFEAGAAWWLDSRELVVDASREQEERFESDPWQEPIAKWADCRGPFSVEEVLEKCLEKLRATWTQGDRNRVGRCLRVLGYERSRQRIAGDRAWLWKRGADR